jgi:hypothetical protein
MGGPAQVCWPHPIRVNTQMQQAGSASLWLRVCRMYTMPATQLACSCSLAMLEHHCLSAEDRQSWARVSPTANLGP